MFYSITLMICSFFLNTNYSNCTNYFLNTDWTDGTDALANRVVFSLARRMRRIFEIGSWAFAEISFGEHELLELHE